MSEDESIYTFSFLSLNLPAFEKKIHSIWPFPWKWSVWQNPDQERTNQNARIYLKTILPYNKYIYPHCSSVNRNVSTALVLLAVYGPVQTGKLSDKSIHHLSIEAFCLRLLQKKCFNVSNRWYAPDLRVSKMVIVATNFSVMEVVFFFPL